MPGTSTVINVRAPSATRDLIDRAAVLQGKTRTDFMLEASSEKARQVLLDQVYFNATPEQAAQLDRILDMPLREQPALMDLLATPSPWDK